MMVCGFLCWARVVLLEMARELDISVMNISADKNYVDGVFSAHVG